MDMAKKKGRLWAKERFGQSLSCLCPATRPRASEAGRSRPGEAQPRSWRLLGSQPVISPLRSTTAPPSDGHRGLPRDWGVQVLNKPPWLFQRAAQATTTTETSENLLKLKGEGQRPFGPMGWLSPSLCPRPHQLGLGDGHTWPADQRPKGKSVIWVDASEHRSQAVFSQ